MAYRALDIAKYIINRCTDNGTPVTNLKLQKILYFVQGEYHQQTGSFLFDDNFLAWQFGPVVRGVYDEYCSYGASAIYELGTLILREKDKKVIDEIIDRRRGQTAGALVAEAHRPGGAWDSVYNGSNQTVIPKQLIKRDFPYMEG